MPCLMGKQSTDPGIFPAAKGREDKERLARVICTIAYRHQATDTRYREGIIKVNNRIARIMLSIIGLSATQLNPAAGTFYA